MDFFKRHFSLALFAVLGLILVAYIGARGNLQIIFGVVVPYLAMLIFVEGFVYRLIQWARSPVPFRIPTPAGPPSGSGGGPLPSFPPFWSSCSGPCASSPSRCPASSTCSTAWTASCIS